MSPIAPFFFFSCVLLGGSVVEGASWVVAAANSPAHAKAKADVVCTGANDTDILHHSLTLGIWRKVHFDTSPSGTGTTKAYCAQSVEWLPGDYHLLTPLVLPQVADTALDAEGAVLHYNSTHGDAVTITGALRTRFRFGMIYSASVTGAALAAKITTTSPLMPITFNVISFQGLHHVPDDGSSGGIGLWIQKGFCVNKIIGTDVKGFGTGIWCNANNVSGTIDTNWYFMNYIRVCHKDIRVEGGNGAVNSQQWHVNVDASIDGATAIQTGGMFDWWRVIMGTFNQQPTTRSIVLDESATDNVFEITPPLRHFDGYQNNAANSNNVFFQVPNSIPPAGTFSHLVPSFQSFNDGPTRFERQAQHVVRRKGKKADVEHRPDDAVVTTIAQLNALKALKDSGILNDEEFLRLKNRILETLTI